MMHGVAWPGRFCRLFPWFRFCLLAVVAVAAAADNDAAKPPLTLANSYHDNINLAEYYVSEKLDGVRAYWNGRELISRQGKRFAAPAWFVAEFPAAPLDGELWSKRGDFERISGFVRRAKPHEGWRQLAYRVFDMPAVAGGFARRLQIMQKTLATIQNPHIKMVRQWTVDSADELQQQMQDIVQQGGEGLMLRHKDAPYRGGRSNDLIKLKPFEDAEAVVMGYKAGRGKFTGMLGSIKVRSRDGYVFYIGSGFTNQQRQQPPPLGATITFRHNGKTINGIPRFPVFLRVRNDAVLDADAASNAADKAGQNATE